MSAPLAGLTVLVTRPRAQSARFAALVREAGGTPLLFPAIEIEPIKPDVASRAGSAPDAHDWTIYTSANAVTHSLRQLERPARTRIAAIGRATARALQEEGLTVHALPASASESEGLLALDPFKQPVGQRILIVKGAGGRTLLREELTRRGAVVATIDVYRRVRARPDAGMPESVALACEAGPVVVAATSSETLDALLEMAGDSHIPRLRDAALLVPGERVAAAARARGWRGPLIVAASAEDAAMVAALVEAAGPTGIVPGRPC